MSQPSRGRRRQSNGLGGSIGGPTILTRAGLIPLPERNGATTLLWWLRQWMGKAGDRSVPTPKAKTRPPDGPAGAGSPMPMARFSYPADFRKSRDQVRKSRGAISTLPHRTARRSGPCPSWSRQECRDSCSRRDFHPVETLWNGGSWVGEGAFGRLAADGGGTVLYGSDIGPAAGQ